MKDFIILTILFFAGLNSSQACQFNGPANFSFGASLEEQRGNFIESETEKVIKPNFILSGCSKTKRKYLQFSLGTVEDYIDNGSNITAINEDFVPAVCHIENSPMESTETAKDLRKRFLQKRKYLTSCFDFYARSINGKDLSMPKQEFCEFEKVGRTKYKLKGNVCYFDINKESEFHFSVEPKKECLEKNFFQNNKIDLQDFLAHIGFNVANSSDGTGKQMITVGASMLRVSHDPLKEIMQVSDDYGRNAPLFPAVWSIPDVHMGEVKVSNQGEFKEISVDFIAKNKCKKICKGGICSSPCHYSSPVAAEIEFYEIPPLPVTIDEDEDDDFFDDFKSLGNSIKAINKPEYLGAWYTGGVAAANWEGVIPGKKFYMKADQLLTGKRYRMKATFRGPKLDYLFLMKKYRSLLPPMPDFTSIASGIPVDLSGSTSSLGDIAKLLSGGGKDGIQRALKKLHSLFSYSAWPVYVNKVCDQSLRNCKKPEKKNNLILNIDFDLENGDDNSINQDKVTNIEVSRKSTVLKSYKLKRENQPKIKCEIE